MRSRLSYYSLILLVGLGIVSALVLTMNPFSGAPASASPAQQGVSVTTSRSVSGSGTLSNSPAAIAPGGNCFGFGLQPGGTSGGHHHHSDDFPGTAGTGGNATATTTTTTGTVYSQDE